MIPTGQPGWRTPLQALAKRPGLRNLLLALLVTLAVAPLHGRSGIRLLEARAFDILSTIAPASPARPGAVIVAIDEPSFAEIGERWPWTRAQHARLVESLRNAGAKAVGIDILFSEPSSPEADAALAAAMKPDSVLAADREVIAMDQGTQISTVGPMPALLAGGAASGITSMDLDGDGVLRHLPEAAGSFAAEVLRVTGAAQASPPPNALIQYFGSARTYPTVSYYQALDPARFLPPGFFKDKIVLVGFSLKAAPKPEAGASDAFATPFTLKSGTLTAGVEVHATLLDNLQHRYWIMPAPALALMAAVALCALLGAGTGQSRLGWKSAAAALGGLAAIAAASWLMLRYGRIWLAPVTPGLAAIAAFGGRLGLDYARERRLRSAVSEAFSRYVTPALVAELARNPDALKLGGERRTLSVLFCDVRGFTTLSETLKDEPERLTSIINRLLDALSEQVLEAQGTIDKYMGDCVMAFWNAPLPAADHARKAVAAALEMSKAVARLNRQLQAEDPTLPRLAVGVGVNTGMCVVGNIGSRWRYDYSVLGDTVNMASRLEGLTKDYSVPLIIGPQTAETIRDDYVTLELDRIAVRGRSEATPIYTVLAPASERDSPELARLIAAHRQLLERARAGDRPGSLEALRICLEAWPALADYHLKIGQKLLTDLPDLTADGR